MSVVRNCTPARRAASSQTQSPLASQPQSVKRAAAENRVDCPVFIFIVLLLLGQAAATRDEPLAAARRPRFVSRATRSRLPMTDDAVAHIRTAPAANAANATPFDTDTDVCAPARTRTVAGTMHTVPTANFSSGRTCTSDARPTMMQMRNIGRHLE